MEFIKQHYIFLYIDLYNMIFILLQAIFVYPFELLGLECQLPKVFEPCREINKNILDTVYDVFEDLRYSGVPVWLGVSNNTICNYDNVHYGQMIRDYKNNTNIIIKSSLYKAPTTCYNVLLHETLHALGLSHSKSPGMMNYAVTESWFGSVVNDPLKLWLSVDDIRGINAVCFQYN